MKTVITYGTFDLFHEGHYNILKRAKEYGDYLIVGVTGENYDIGRGKLSVHDTLADRMENVKATGLVDKIIVEEYLGQKIDDIVKYGVDTFVIGDDWKGKFDHLSRYCNMVYLERTKGISSTQIRQETFDSYSIGIITDIVDDNQIVHDAKAVNGFSVQSVYSHDEKIRADFKRKYQIETVTNSYEELIDSSDIVYIRCGVKKRYNLIKEALTSGKHVICDPPFTLKKDEQIELLQLAKKNNLILIANIKMCYIYVYNQLLWMARGGLIGDLLSFNCSLSRNDKNRENIFYDLLYLTLVQLIKIMGSDYDKLVLNTKKEGDNVEFASLVFNYPDSTACINVGNKIRVRNQIEIIGTEGTIRADENWWRGNQFYIDKAELDYKETYNTNYSGNGFKYLLKAMSRMLQSKRYKEMGIFDDESVKIAEIMETIADKI